MNPPLPIPRPGLAKPAFATAAVLLLQAAGAAVVTFTEATNPVGIFSSSANVQTSTTVSTREAPFSGNNAFTHWTLNGVRLNDASGRSRNPATFVILEPTAAVAHYLPATQDSDGDGLLDWREIEFYGSLVYNAASDTDGDGLSTAAELNINSSPVAVDLLSQGGISRRRGAKIQVAEPSSFTLTETSSPLGIVQNTRSVAGGVPVPLSIAPTYSTSLVFSGWYVNGTRVDSPLAQQPAFVTLTGATTAVARYIDSTVDSDADGIPDWQEWFYFSGLDQDGSADGDGDGFTLAQEILRGQVPQAIDEIGAGGISRRRSGLTGIAPVTFVSYSLTSDPAGYVNQTLSAANGSTVTTNNLSGVSYNGNLFAGWEVNGMRQTDASGASAGSARFTAANGVVAKARFISTTADSDGDGISDWYEYFYTGSQTGPATDNDGDGFDFAAEYARGQSPLTNDELVAGGISRRRSTGLSGVNLQPYERLRDVLAGGVLTHWFTEDPAASPPTGLDLGNHASPALCDWDGDGDLDVFIAYEGGVAVHENTGTRFQMDLSDRSANFSALATLCSGIAQPRLAAGDWNGDGDDDLLLSDSLGQLHLIPSSGSFTGSGNGSATGSFAPGGDGVIPALGDLDGNGSPDLLLANLTGVISYYPNTGNAAAPFASASPTALADTPVSGISSLTIADITLDGLNDVLAADSAGRIWEFHALASGGYLLSSKVWGGSGDSFAPAPQIAAFDFEGDGDVDLLGGTPDGGIFALRDPHVGRPTGLVATPGADNILLEWTPDWQSRILGYNVYRSNSAGAAKARINSGEVSLPQYVDENLQFVPTHYYHVTGLSRAIYAGNSVPTLLESPASPTVSASVRQVLADLKDANSYPGGHARGESLAWQFYWSLGCRLGPGDPVSGRTDAGGCLSHRTGGGAEWTGRESGLHQQRGCGEPQDPHSRHRRQHRLRPGQALHTPLHGGSQCHSRECAQPQPTHRSLQG